MTPATQQHPEPRPGARSVFPEVRRLMDERERKGIETYGRPLETFNGRSSLRDATEEALDLSQYLVQLRMELEDVYDAIDLAMAAGGSVGFEMMREAKAKLRAILRKGEA